jgi:alkanesulfonate monooxygenase SsuD/methylene tetrahydromethanopterin reductase-like flavin-dependent oxidoreductase (luciferase family)
LGRRDGETVTHFGHVRVDEARLYTLPERPPRQLGAAITPETARWMGSWVDGLITVAGPRALLNEVVEAFRAGGGEGKPMVLQVHVAYAASVDEALQGAHEQWRHVRVSVHLDEHVEWLQEDVELGFEEIYLHNTHREQRRFIEDFGAQVIPALRSIRTRVGRKARQESRHG